MGTANNNWTRIMAFQKVNRRKATLEESFELLSCLREAGVPEEYESQWHKDMRVYPLFDAAAMAVNYWEREEFGCPPPKDLTKFTDKVCELLK